MMKIIIDWYDNYCKVNSSSDLFKDLPVTIWKECSKEIVEESIKKQISNLYCNHYGKLEEQTEIIHNFY